LQINPHLLGTAVPAIPEAKSWAASYDGGNGPLIDLSQGAPGYPAHPEMLERLGVAAASAEAARYGDIAGDADLRVAYAAHVATLYDAQVASENVAVTAGCNQAFFAAMVALAKAGDSVILPSPWYFNHKMTLDMLGIEAVPLPCHADAGFVPDLSEARSLLGPRVRAVVLVTPSNPTGAAYPPGTITAFQSLCAEHGIALVIDETYRDFLKLGASPHKAFAAPDWDDTLVQLYSFSKSYCIPGHRVGAMVAAPSFITETAKVLDCLQICATRTPQLVLPWAIPELTDWRTAKRAEILARADAFIAALNSAPGWSICSIGAYFAYVQHPFPQHSAANVAEHLARERGVLCLPGSYFGPGQDRYLRVAFANVGTAAIEELPKRLAGVAL
jgi:aspartate/methionine/tyrosine aminotransferase